MFRSIRKIVSPKFNNPFSPLNKIAQSQYGRGSYTSVHSKNFGMMKRILLLTNSHNSMSQAAQILLIRMGHKVMIELAVDKQQMISCVQNLKPDLIVCPFLTKVVPPEVFKNVKTLIIHPGKIFDRGMSALDWVLLRGKKEWGVTILEADVEMDAGPIYAYENFLVPNDATKSSLYRNQVVPAAMKALSSILENNNNKNKTLEPLTHIDPSEITGTLNPTMKQSDNAIDWEQDDAETIVRKIRCRDSQPGLLTKLYNGQEVFLYNAQVCKEFHHTGFPVSAIITESPNKNGAVLLSAAGNTAFWVSHMKVARSATIVDKARCNDYQNFKLPATLVLNPFSKFFAGRFKEYVYEEVVVEKSYSMHTAFIHFNFYNGAMSTQQCQLLVKTLRAVKQDPSIRILVLCGSKNYFSNGIHLNMIEHAEDPVQESCNNINAMNDVVYEIMTAKGQFTISALQGNAGAGGVMMAIASDLVVAHENVLLNPHYRTMGLYGSEYWTYNLPRRVGISTAFELTEACEPISSKQALEIKLIDRIMGKNSEELMQTLRAELANQWNSQEYFNIHIVPRLQEKYQEQTNEWLNLIHHIRQWELKIMNENFRSEAYEQARKSFVYKLPVSFTPFHLLKQGRERCVWMNGSSIAKKIIEQIKQKQQNIGINRKPCLACIIVGKRADSILYVQKKKIAAEEAGMDVQIIAIDENEKEYEIVQRIEALNQDSHCDGILLQLPLPTKLDPKHIIESISAEKDVDGLTKTSKFKPCTSLGIMELLRVYGIQLAGKHVCVVGSSRVVGLPVSLECLQLCATVTICNIHTQDLQQKIQTADIIITATGHRGILKANWFRDQAVVIDAGVAFDNEGKVHGDVDATNIESRPILISPPINGCGPLTIAMLIKNTFEAFENNTKTTL